MAQNRKAKESPERAKLREAAAKAAKKVQEAAQDYAVNGSLANLRALQVATDEATRTNDALCEYDDARDPAAVRRMDANPKRSRPAWPVGKQEPARPKRRATDRPDPADRKPPLPPPPPPRPPVLASREVPNGHGGKERVSWWVGADRSQLKAGAAAVATAAPPSRTTVPATRTAVKTQQQQQNDAKRDARREEAARRFNEKLQPMAGAFTSIPRAD